jgi:hypothetical protein
MVDHIPKPNLTQIDKLKIASIAASECDPKTQIVPTEVLRDLSNMFNVTENTIRNVWKQFQQHKRANLPSDQFLRPKKKARRDDQGSFLFS